MSDAINEQMKKDPAFALIHTEMLTRDIVDATGAVIATITADKRMSGISITTAGIFFTYHQVTQIAATIVEFRDWMATPQSGAKQYSDAALRRQQEHMKEFTPQGMIPVPEYLTKYPTI